METYRKKATWTGCQIGFALVAWSVSLYAMIHVSSNLMQVMLLPVSILAIVWFVVSWFATLHYLSMAKFEKWKKDNFV